jgi:hypothetical protein
LDAMLPASSFRQPVMQKRLMYLYYIPLLFWLVCKPPMICSVWSQPYTVAVRITTLA